jgi:hypothetical protein
MFNLAEEFPSIQVKHALKMTLIATLIVVAAIAAYLYWGRHPPAAQGEMLQLTPYQGEITTPPSVIVTQSSPPLLVLTRVLIQNKSSKPLSIFDLSAILIVGQNRYRSLDVSGIDFTRVFEYYPALNSEKEQPLLRHTVIGPGNKVEGLMIFDYPIDMNQWNLRSSFEIDVAFDNEKDLVIADAGEPANTTE